MKDRIISFCRQHILLLCSLFVMTLGVVLCVMSMLGSSVISVLPYFFQEAGSDGLVPDLTIVPDTITYKSITQIAWCTVLAFVISLEVSAEALQCRGKACR